MARYSSTMIGFGLRLYLHTFIVTSHCSPDALKRVASFNHGSSYQRQHCTLVLSWYPNVSMKTSDTIGTYCSSLSVHQNEAEIEPPNMQAFRCLRKCTRRRKASWNEIPTTGCVNIIVKARHNSDKGQVYFTRSLRG